MSHTRRLAAILAADVAGYSRLMGQDEEGTHERFTAHCRQLVDPKIQEHRGRIVKRTGDGLLVEFGSVVDAVRCAAEIQRCMVDRNGETAEDRRITFRIGVNLGDIIADGADIYGDGVNIAARLEALAEPGGICISRVVREQTRDKTAYPFEDMGEQSAKNIARPVRVYAMNAAAVASLPPVAAPVQPVVRIREISEFVSPPVPRLSIVVLPFANHSNDPEQEYFADGITDDLTTDLSRISGSFVIARSTAFTYKGKAVDVKHVGQELGVRYVLEGSVRRAGNHVRMNVQLIDAESGANLWADRFDTDRVNLAEAQDEITGRLARTLNLELVEAVGRRIEQERAVDPDARDLVMRGWAWFYLPRSATTVREALEAFERAVRLDPQSIDARIGIATILVTNLTGGWNSSVQQNQARAERLLLETLEHDTNRSMAHYAMGVLRRSQSRLTELRTELETAIALDRNNARAFHQLGHTLRYLGQPGSGIPHIEKAIRLNPRDPFVAHYYYALGSCHLVLGHLDEATALLTRARAGNPRIWYIHLWLAGALGLKRDLDEARAALDEGIKLEPRISSLARWRAHSLWATKPEYVALAETTLYAGLRRAGFPDE